MPISSPGRTLARPPGSISISAGWQRRSRATQEPPCGYAASSVRPCPSPCSHPQVHSPRSGSPRTLPSGRGAPTRHPRRAAPAVLHTPCFVPRHGIACCAGIHHAYLAYASYADALRRPRCPAGFDWEHKSQFCGTLKLIWGITTAVDASQTKILGGKSPKNHGAEETFPPKIFVWLALTAVVMPQISFTVPQGF